MSKMELGEMIHHKGGGRSRRLELLALAGGGPRSSATLLSLLQGARARPVLALQRWEEKMLGTRMHRRPEGSTKVSKNLRGL